MISAKKIMNIKVVELIKIYNFYFGHFFIRQSCGKHCSKFTSLSYTTLSNEEMTKIKVVDLEKLHNFVVDNFFI